MKYIFLLVVALLITLPARAERYEDYVTPPDVPLTVNADAIWMPESPLPPPPPGSCPTGTPVSGGCYFGSTSGSDSNAGNTESAPLLHLPGMTGCTATCASITPASTQGFILRGGDVYNYNSSGGVVGLPWNWTWSGNSSCNIDLSSGPLALGPCIYVGVDQSWFTGSSWTRPAMNMNNPPSTNYVSSCAFDQSSVNFMSGNGQYLILDNFEWKQWCWSAAVENAKVVQISANTMVENMLFDSWTTTAGAMDQFLMIGPITCCVNQVITKNIFDGSKSTLSGKTITSGSPAITVFMATGKALGAGSEISYNAFYHVSNVYIGGAANWIHDNLGTQLWEPQDNVCPAPGCPTHGNYFEQGGSPPCGTYFYNNNFNTGNMGEGQNLYSGSGCNVWVFNNLSFLYRAVVSGGSTIVNGTDGGNCWLAENSGGSGPRTWHIFNNTLDSPCVFGQKAITLTQITQNNHLIGFSPQAMSSLMNPTISDSGNEIFQTESQANTQGYLPGNNYSTPAGGATIGAGANLNSLCSTITISAIAADCKSGYRGITYNPTTETITINTPVARPAGGAWDAGYQQFASGGTGSASAAPTGLSYGTVTRLTTSPSQTVTLTNGSTAITGLASSFTGANASDFTVSGGSCGSALPASSSCTYLVVFTPTATAGLGESATLGITFSGPTGSPQSVALTGTSGTGPAVTFSPAAIVFGNQTPTTTSANLVLTATSSGSTNLVLAASNAVTLTGTNAADFAVASTTCTNGLSIAPLSTCTITLNFTPSATGLRTAQINLSDNASGSPQVVPLSGTGATPAPAVGAFASNLTIPGSNFIPTTTVNYNGVNCTATYVSPQMMNANCTGGGALTVSNPAPPTSCSSVAANTWPNFPIGSQTGTFTVTSIFTPGIKNQDAVIGLGKASVSAYTQLGPIVRFNDTGQVDARNGGGYSAVSPLNYLPGTSYKIEFDGNVKTRIYSAYVWINGTKQAVAQNYAFRSDLSTAALLSTLAVNIDTSGSAQICNVTP